MSAPETAPSPAPKRGKVEQKVKYPEYIGSSFASLLVFLMGATMRADWLLFAAYYWKSQSPSDDLTNSTSSSLGEELPLDYTDASLPWNDRLSAYLAIRLENLTLFMVPAFLVSYIFFFGIGGFLHYWYYVRQRDRPEEWKCQPKQWLSAELERHEIIVGFFSLNIGSFLSSVLACWVVNDGWSMVYYKPDEYGYLWLALQLPVIFIWTDYITYWAHRIYHLPFLYKHFHKLHHYYKQPTAYSVTAIHPVEFVSIQAVYISPMFLFPVHWVPYVTVLLYTYYHGIIDHSGITFKRHWWQPWQPDCIFHDNHHQYFHVNFGFNIELWDKLHGTMRRKDRVYHEDAFYGTGIPLAEATEEELAKDLAERVSENPLAYAHGRNANELTEKDIKSLKEGAKKNK